MSAAVMRAAQAPPHALSTYASLQVIRSKDSLINDLVAKLTELQEQQQQQQQQQRLEEVNADCFGQ
jgi:hypothetical protein